MSVDFSIFLPRDPLSVARLKSLMTGHGWTILTYESLRESGSVPTDETEEGLDVVGWESGATDVRTVSRAVEDGSLDSLFEDLGICELSCTTGDELEELLEQLCDGLEPRLAKRLQKCRTQYVLSAPAGSPAQATPELQDTLFEALSGLPGAVTEVDGELS